MTGIIVGVVVAYLVYASGALARFGVGQPTTLGINVPTRQQNVAPNVQDIQASAQTDSAVLGGVSGAANLIPIAGPAIGSAFKALTSILLSASAARAKAAISENTAVAAALPGWDQAVTAIANAYNNGSITAPQAQQSFALTLANFWAEMQGKIQSGRNGCNYGTNCPPTTGPVTDINHIFTAGFNGVNGATYCSGSIGAACCVGCADLALAVANLQWAVAQADKTGQPTAAYVQAVFASKYGGANRASYNVYFTPPNA